jgi:hypothetical protein
MGGMRVYLLNMKTHRVVTSKTVPKIESLTNSAMLWVEGWEAQRDPTFFYCVPGPEPLHHGWVNILVRTRETLKEARGKNEPTDLLLLCHSVFLPSGWTCRIDDLYNVSWNLNGNIHYQMILWRFGHKLNIKATQQVAFTLFGNACFHSVPFTIDSAQSWHFLQ